MTKKTLTIMVLAIILAWAAGVVVGWKIPAPAGLGNKTALDAAHKTGYDEGWEAAKKKISDSGYSFAFDIKKMDGEIASIDGNKLVIKTQPLSPFADPGLSTRTITVKTDGTDAVNIYRLDRKDEIAYRTEMIAYNQKIIDHFKNGADKPATFTSPNLYNRASIQFSEIKVGNLITVYSDQNISESKEIKPLEIEVRKINK